MRRPHPHLAAPRFVRSRARVLALGTCFTLACAGNPDGQTLAQLRDRDPDLSEAPIDAGIDQAMAGYRKFLEEAPESALTPEAMRRLADLKLEKEYGLLEAPAATTQSREALPAPDRSAPKPTVETGTRPSTPQGISGRPSESESAFVQRASGEVTDLPSAREESLSLPGGESANAEGPLEAIALYDQILETYPDYAHNDQVLYQKARAFDELGRVDEAIAVAALLVERYPESRHLDEIQFRRAEYFFTRKKYFEAEKAYNAIIDFGATSDYYELALYKLGWTLYKQMFLEEALQSYVTLLDHKVSIGYDFDQTEDEAAQQRVSDTYRVMSLCFSELGGAEAITSFFDLQGSRSYEDRVYRNLGEFYLEKLRYNDAASVYQAFVDLYPIHRSSPHFSMRVVEIYEAGDFPILVLESKKAFAASYGLDSEYWRHFSVEDAPEVFAYLKSNLKDLANHYHALYQSSDSLEEPVEKTAHFQEAELWYRTYLTSFPAEPETPEIHYQLADLLLENEDFGAAAGEYERIAYDYPEHERSAQAGYAAIFSYREQEKRFGQSERETVKRLAVASTLRFVDRFPTHEHAAAVLSAATDDLYALEDHLAAIETGRRLIDQYPDSDPTIRRSAWLAIAHASFDIEDFEPAEQAYASVLELTTAEDEARQDVMNNLAAAIYKQGEQARARDDYQTAAAHFLRIAEQAPLSSIRPIAEYDAGAALIHLEDWTAAASVLESFRSTFPEHDLNQEATRQVAFVYREDGNLGRAAEEYERVASEATDPEMRRESLLLAGELYEEAELFENALAVYDDYVTEFTTPIEPAVVTHSKMAGLYLKTGDDERRRAALRTIVTLDRNAGDSRTDRVRVIAAKSALTLSEAAYHDFAGIELMQPFESSLQQKQRGMDAALSGFNALVDYEVGEVTAAATYYIGEIYAEFSRALLESERPGDLGPTELDEYEMVLEENAYPFEEKSIAIHEKNLELMSAGVYNAWIEKSLAKLAVAMPGRYAKFEVSSGLIPSIKTYTYRAPATAPLALMEAAADGPTDVIEGPATAQAAAPTEQNEETETAAGISEPMHAGQVPGETAPGEATALGEMASEMPDPVTDTTPAQTPPESEEASALVEVDPLVEDSPGMPPASPAPPGVLDDDASQTAPEGKEMSNVDSH